MNFNMLLINEKERIQIMGLHSFLWLFILCLVFQGLMEGVQGLACNWGTKSTHPLPPKVAVRLMKDNGFDKVKLFEPDAAALRALGHSGIQVMLGIPNDLLGPLANSVSVAEQWVRQNVSSYISRYGVDIRYVAVGNEPFLKSYNDMFIQSTFPALQNVQAALIKAGLGRQVKATVPLNADVYQSDNGLPSSGDFRPEIHDLMMSILGFLSSSAYPVTINIYPFLSLYADPNFPIEYAFFDGTSNPIVDGSIKYTNTLEANFDTLISALEKNGFGSLPVIVGEVGWPTDGDAHANTAYARRFNQGLIDRIIHRKGTPKRPTPPDIYIFGLIDEDAKSIEPGNFERHWGIFNHDGRLKYQLNLGNGRSLVPAKGVKYLKKQWCVLSPQASMTDPSLQKSIDYACSKADCTSLGYGSSCGNLDARNNASYAFNMYYQTMDQRKGACGFNNLAIVTNIDPSRGSCRFEVMIDLRKQGKSSASQKLTSLVTLTVVLMCIVYAIL